MAKNNKNQNNNQSQELKGFKHKRYIGFAELIFRKIFLICAFLAVSIISLLMSFNSEKVASLYYKEQSNLDYLVYLKENDYYDTNYLKKDMSYIASLIDHIDVKFNYNFEMNDKLDFDYKYYIESLVKVTEKNNPTNVIYEKSEKLTEDTIKNIENADDFNINENIEIDYDYYNDLIKAFKSDYNIVAESSLKLTLHIEIEGNHPQITEAIKASNKMELTIPLTEQTINVSMNYKDINNKSVVNEDENLKLNNYLYLGVSIVFSILTIIVSVSMIKILLKFSSKKSLFQKKINKLLREYDQVIVEIKKPENILKQIDTSKIIELGRFEELLDVSDRIEQPILYIDYHKNQKCWFIVKDKEETYRYILKAVDLENNN